MKPCLIFDIETAPSDDWDDPDFIGELLNQARAPTNYKDPEKIAAAKREKVDSQRDAAALSWLFGRIRAIGVGGLLEEFPPTVWASEDEAEVIASFALYLDDAGPAVIGGFNVREFDVPFVTFRAAVHRIELPTWWPARRPYGNGIVDPVDLLGRNGRLADHLRAMGLPKKTADGADAPGMSVEELGDYCANDVLCERMLIRRLASAFPALRERD